MGIKQRLLRAEKRCPAPDPSGWPGLPVFLAERKRLMQWLAENGITAEEAHRQRMKVPGNTFLTLKAWVKMERLKPQWEAQQKAEEERRRAEQEARMSRIQQGASTCMSSSGDLKT